MKLIIIDDDSSYLTQLQHQLADFQHFEFYVFHNSDDFQNYIVKSLNNTLPSDYYILCHETYLPREQDSTWLSLFLTRYRKQWMILSEGIIEKECLHQLETWDIHPNTDHMCMKYQRTKEFVDSFMKKQMNQDDYRVLYKKKKGILHCIYGFNRVELSHFIKKFCKGKTGLVIHLNPFITDENTGSLSELIGYIRSGGSDFYQFFQYHSQNQNRHWKYIYGPFNMMDLNLMDKPMMDKLIQWLTRESPYDDIVLDMSFITLTPVLLELLESSDYAYLMDKDEEREELIRRQTKVKWFVAQ